MVADEYCLLLASLSPHFQTYILKLEKLCDVFTLVFVKSPKLRAVFLPGFNVCRIPLLCLLTTSCY